MSNQISHVEKYRQFLLCKGSHYVVQLNWLSPNKNEWIIKEDTGKPMNNVSHVMQYAIAKKHVLG